MTWNVRIIKPGKLAEAATTVEANACTECKHGQPDPARHYNTRCHIPGASWPIANMLTSIDVGSDGHIAGGNAVLECSGFEELEAQPADTADAKSEHPEPAPTSDAAGAQTQAPAGGTTDGSNSAGPAS